MTTSLRFASRDRSRLMRSASERLSSRVGLSSTRWNLVVGGFSSHWGRRSAQSAAVSVYPWSWIGGRLVRALLSPSWVSMGTRTSTSLSMVRAGKNVAPLDLLLGELDHQLLLDLTLLDDDTALAAIA